MASSRVDFYCRLAWEWVPERKERNERMDGSCDVRPATGGPGSGARMDLLKSAVKPVRPNGNAGRNVLIPAQRRVLAAGRRRYPGVRA